MAGGETKREEGVGSRRGLGQNFTRDGMPVGDWSGGATRPDLRLKRLLLPAVGLCLW